MFDLIATGGFQISLLIVIVLAVAGGIAVTAIRHRVVPQPVGLTMAAAEPIPVAPRPSAASGPLAILEFDDDPKIVSVARPRVMIGRHSDDDIRIRDVTVSRHHALLELGLTGDFEIHNQTAGREEPNQLLINGVYKDHSVLADGDLVTLGGVTFRFRRQLLQSA
ncbi:MAG: FHA domain-containing protein [Ancalomicrobiaceae bacterium]|nr:FHA domain-containing protein [Ancalomicrobiaceae bacterium]